MRANPGEKLLLGLLVTAVAFVVLRFCVADSLAGYAARRVSSLPTPTRLCVLRAK